MENQEDQRPPTSLPIQVGLRLILLTTWEGRPARQLSLSLPHNRKQFYRRCHSPYNRKQFYRLFGACSVSAALARASFHPEFTQTGVSGASASSLPPCPLAMHVPFSGVVFLKQKPDAIQGFLRHRSKIQGLCQQAATPSYLCPLLTPPCHHAGCSQ